MKKRTIIIGAGAAAAVWFFFLRGRSANASPATPAVPVFKAPKALVDALRAKAVSRKRDHSMGSLR